MPSIYPEKSRTEWIIARRPARENVDPRRPYGFFLEQERSAVGAIVSSATILLTNKECPWHCLMCDLWKHTLTAPVPVGAIPQQIDYALSQLGVEPEQAKLYNSGSFFDPAAIPLADYPAITERLSFADRVIVEAHPRLVGDAGLGFARMLKGSLEVALGLETVHPDVLPRLNKRFTLDQFERATGFLRSHGIGVRVFVLIKPPFLNDQEAIYWAVKSAAFAFSCGAGVVSLIPTRGGNGALDELAKAGEFSPPSLATVEKCLERCLEMRAGRVFVDTWDLEKFSSCAACLPARKQRLLTANLTQCFASLAACSACGA